MIISFFVITSFSEAFRGRHKGTMDGLGCLSPGEAADKVGIGDPIGLLGKIIDCRSDFDLKQKLAFTLLFNKSTTMAPARPQ